MAKKDKEGKNHKEGKKSSGGPKSTKDKDVMTQKMKVPIDTKLSDAEVAKLARELVDTRGKIAGKEAEKKAADAAIKGDIELLEESATKLQEIIRDGTRKQDIDCEVQWDWKTCEVRLMRLDTKEVVKRRTMNADERQKEMFEAGAKQGKGNLLFFDGGMAKDRSEVKDVPKGDGGELGGDKPGKRVKKSKPQPGDTIEVETISGWKTGKLLPSSGSMLDVDVGDGKIEHAPVDGQTWRWPSDKVTAGEPGLSASLGEIAAATAAKKGNGVDKRLKDGAPVLADELVVKTPTGPQKGTVVRIEGGTLFVDIHDGSIPVRVDINSKDWSWPDDREGETPVRKGKGKKGLRLDGDENQEGLDF